MLHLGDGRLLVGESYDKVRVHDASTGTVLQTLSSSPMSLARGPGRLFTFLGDVYKEQNCTNPECDPNTDPCCDPDTCTYDKCDPSEDPCCSATTCDFDECNPEVNSCCDAATCTFKAATATCVQSTGAGAGCRTGQCNASHVCQPVAVSDLDDGTLCVAQASPCFTGQCDDGVCHPPDGPGGEFADRCEDANQCTNDEAACVQDVFGKFVRCGFKDPDVFEPNGTNCSTTSGAICTVKTCQNGQCQPVSPPETIDCSALPAVQTCHFNSCQLDEAGDPECVADQLVPAGTVCESTVPSTDWDCKHYRCGSKGRCRAKRAIEGKACDFQPGITPSAHCRLGVCSAKAQCLSPLYSTHSVIEDMETAALDSDGNPVLANLATCPSDGNFCTVDRCAGGMSDSCINPCLPPGTECGVPGVCEGECQIVGSSCQCAEAP